MGYDLNFWKYAGDGPRDHQSVYQRLSDGQHVEGLEDLPIARVRERLAECFSVGWNRPDGDNWEGRTGAFQLFTTRQFLRIDCYGNLDRDIMNQLIDIGLETGGALYDPQVGKRFD